MEKRARVGRLTGGLSGNSKYFWTINLMKSVLWFSLSDNNVLIQTDYSPTLRRYRMNGFCPEQLLCRERDEFTRAKLKTEK